MGRVVVSTSLKFHPYLDREGQSSRSFHVFQLFMEVITAFVPVIKSFPVLGMIGQDDRLFLVAGNRYITLKLRLAIGRARGS